MAKSVADVACSLNKECIGLNISNLVTRNDRFREVAVEASVSLTEFCLEHNTYLIDHTNTIKTSYLNRSKLHLNQFDRNV